MAKQLIFLTDTEKSDKSDKLEIYANDEGMLTISMEDVDDQYSFNCIKLTKESALELIEHIKNELDLL